MRTSVNISANLVKKAQARCIAQGRSITKQIEYWARIGRIAEDNPDLPFNAVKGILLGLADLETGNIENYTSICK